MGQDLFDATPEYRAIEGQVDSILGYSLREMCLVDRDNRLKETQFTQPCLFAVNALHYFKARREGLRPSYLAGHSLGEYNALHAAGVFDFVTGLRLVKKRGELMSQARGGAMGAVIGLGVSVITKVMNDDSLSSLDVANFNSPLQTVVSGPVDAVHRAGPLFEKRGAKLYMPLQVSAAFHSRYMADAARKFEDYLAPFRFDSPATPVVANVTAEPYPNGGGEDSIKSLLVRQIDHSVRWNQSVRWLMNHGVDDFRELGPGNVLTRMLQQIRQEQDA